MLSHILMLLTLGFATCSPVTPSYHYVAGGRAFRLLDHNVPITFNGIPIGTTELNSTAVAGTTHQLSEGHHFTHPGWVLSGNNSSNARWEYLPDLRHLDAQLKTRATTLTLFEEFQIASGLTYRMEFGERLFLDDIVTTVGTITSGAVQSATSVSYLTTQIDYSMDIWDGGSIIVVTNSLTADFENLFFTALEFFA